MKKNLLFLIFGLFLTTTISAQLSSASATKSAREIKSAIVVFPNPATNFIGVTDEYENVATLAVYNLVGRKLKDFNTEDGDRFYIAELTNGIYLVQLKDDDSKIIKTQRLRVR